MPNTSARGDDIAYLQTLIESLSRELSDKVMTADKLRASALLPDENLLYEIFQRRRYLSELKKDLSDLSNLIVTDGFDLQVADGSPNPDGLAIVIGHSPEGDRGAEGVTPPFPAQSTQGKSEYYWNRDLAERAAAVARAQGIRVEIFHRMKNGAIGVREAYRLVKAWNPLASVELHFNSADAPSAHGTETLYGADDSIPWAKSLQASLVKLFDRQGHANRGLKDARVEGRGVASLTNDVQPSALIEPFFGHNRDDAELGVGKKQALAQAVVEAFLGHVASVPVNASARYGVPRGDLWSRLRDQASETPVVFPQLKGIAFAQWALESGFGTSPLGVRHQNFAGMKWRPFMRDLATQQWYDAHDGGDYYCKFDTLEKFVQGYWARLDRHPSYRGWQQHTATPEDFFGFIANIWAPPNENPNYVSKVLSIYARLKSEGRLPTPGAAAPIPAHALNSAASLDRLRSGPIGYASGISDEDHWVDQTEEEVWARVRAQSPEFAAARARLAAQVKWPADEASCDYAHLQSALPAGVNFALSAADLEFLSVANDFPAAETGNRPVLFGLRGAAIVSGDSSGDGAWRDEVILQDRRPNHFDARCVMGVWSRTTGKIAVYPGSTVPNADAVTQWLTSRDAGNMLPAGFYRYICGEHNGRPGCFLLRKPDGSKRSVIVRRSSDNLIYENTDVVDNCQPGDNIHPAFSDNPSWFSSLGCQVVIGKATTSGQHAGPWSQFRRSAGLTDGNGEPGAAFVYMLLTGREALLASQLRQSSQTHDPVAQSALRRLRFGSSGAAVKLLQAKLGAVADGGFGAATAELLHAMQRSLAQGRSDGIYTPKLDEALGWGVFNVTAVAAASGYGATVPSSLKHAGQGFAYTAALAAGQSTAPGAVRVVSDATEPGWSREATNDGTFNAEILASVTRIASDWRSQGYDINSYFTHHLKYGPDCCIKANHPPKTMCVAAVTEIIVDALNFYYAATGDRTPFDKLPMQSWKGGSKRDIRPHIFMYDDLNSNGTAHALERFGIGRQVPFSSLKPGGFINFNRTHSGHACVFLAYLDNTGNELAVFGPDVAGYKYFSAQGRNSPDAGFAYRWAFFEGHCPTLSGGRPRDCGVIRSERPEYFCCGHLLHPSQWPDRVAIERAVIEAIGPRGFGARTAQELEYEMGRELPPPDLSRFDGVTTD